MKFIGIFLSFIYAIFFSIEIPLGLGMGLHSVENVYLVNFIVLNYVIVLLSVILTPFSVIYGFAKDNHKYYFKYPLMSIYSLILPCIGGFILALIFLVNVIKKKIPNSQKLHCVASPSGTTKPEQTLNKKDKTQIVTLVLVVILVSIFIPSSLMLTLSQANIPIVIVNACINLISLILIPFSIFYGIKKKEKKYYIYYPLTAYICTSIPNIGGLILLIIFFVEIIKLKKNNIKRTVE